ncbi:class I SAM-dependent methyltransferase [uncultured Ruegeria sp.]|uniref:class I SAM-dependent methyltransferase n=1 Tax=uncultured Ruegeria sp. TaxID=259304 RepID=UPI0026363ECA|nr:class I SAM-dependent methyltransferase [uncultured Ruegeria sp.]
MKCRHCAHDLTHEFLDLGAAPPSNAYLTTETLHGAEMYLPLRLLVCDQCFLVQTEDYASADTYFNEEYAYFSSTSQSWIAHAAKFCNDMQSRFDLNEGSLVIEVASNDGYLLKNFVGAGIPCLGIEPTDSTAEVAERIGVPTLRKFFGDALGQELASSESRADLICGNNVYAHVPDINDFTRGLAAVLKPEGVVSLEFPHLMRLVDNGQFDTVYHEHFSYLSLLTVSRIFATAGLRIFDVQQLSTHGGSLRVLGCLAGAAHEAQAQVDVVLSEERARSMDTLPYYMGFQQRADAIKNAVLHFLLEARAEGKTVAGYGAAAKGNTLLNYAGVKPDLLPFVCDAAEAKIGKFLPGSRIPIRAPSILRNERPDYLLILPWNIAAEVRAQCADLAEQGTRFVTVVPELNIS